MIVFTVWKSEDQYRGYELTGHAEFAESGQDIICAAVSALVINMINSVEELTEDDYSVEQATDGGFLRMEFEECLSEKARLLMDSLILGLRSIEAEYGNEYITLITEEV